MDSHKYDSAFVSEHTAKQKRKNTLKYADLQAKAIPLLVEEGIEPTLQNINKKIEELWQLK